MIGRVPIVMVVDGGWLSVGMAELGLSELDIKTHYSTRPKTKVVLWKFIEPSECSI